MALTRPTLKGMQLTEEQVESIIEMHLETVNGLKSTISSLKDEAEKNLASIDSLKADVKKYKTEAEKVKGLSEELEKAKNDIAEKDKKIDDLGKEYADFKTNTEQKETKAAIDSAAKAYLESKNITGKNLNLAMRAAADAINALELNDGKIKDTSKLDELITGDLAGLVTTIQVKGANVPNPPGNEGGVKTKADILKIKDTAERQAAIKEAIEAGSEEFKI